MSYLLPLIRRASSRVFCVDVGYGIVEYADSRLLKGLQVVSCQRRCFGGHFPKQHIAVFQKIAVEGGFHLGLARCTPFRLNDDHPVTFLLQKVDVGGDFGSAFDLNALFGPEAPKRTARCAMICEFRVLFINRIFGCDKA
jgi:hypothetical protein